METYGLYHTQGMEHESHDLYACQIRRIFKMLLHNWEDFVNFDQPLGFGYLHTKSGNFSLKLLNFKDFFKIQQADN